MERQNENIFKLILDNLFLNEISSLRYTCKQTFLLSCIVNRLTAKQNRLYYRMENKIDIVYNNFRYENKGFQTKYHLNVITKIDLNTLACAFNDGSISLYCLNTQTEVKSIHLSNSPIKLMTFKDGLFATFSYDNNIRVFNITKPSDYICFESNSNINKLILLNKDYLIVNNPGKIIKYKITYNWFIDKLLKAFRIKKKCEVLYECTDLLDVILLNEEILVFSSPEKFGIYNIRNKCLESEILNNDKAYIITKLSESRFVAFYSTCLKIWDINEKSIINEFSFLKTTNVSCALIFNEYIIIYITSSDIFNGLDIRTNKLLFQYKVGSWNINSILKQDEYYFISSNLSGYITFWDIRNINLCKSLEVKSNECPIALKNTIAIIKSQTIYLYSTISNKLIQSINLNFYPRNTYLKLDDYSIVLTDYNDVNFYFDIKSFKIKTICYQIDSICALRNKFIVLKSGIWFKLFNYDFRFLDEREYDITSKCAMCVMNRNTFVTGDFKLIIWEINKHNKLSVRETIQNNSFNKIGVKYLLKLDSSTFIVGNNESISIWDVELAQCIRDLEIFDFKNYSVPILKGSAIVYVDKKYEIKFISLYEKKVVSFDYYGLKDILA
jgi:hypothetical protein